MPADRYGAFCTHAEVSIPGREGGPLAGLKFAIKDLIAIA